MKIWDKIVGAAKTDLYCSFCSSPRAAVGYLVAGPEVYICDRCIALCVAVVDGAKLEKGETQLWTIYRTLPALAEGLQPDVRDANADRLLDIAEAIVRSDAEMLRWAATLARYLGRSQRSRALLLRIDAGARDREAALDLAASCFDLGQFDEAREAIESLPAGPEVDAARLLIRLGRRVIEGGATGVDMGPIERVSAIGENAGVRFAQPAAVVDAALELRRTRVEKARDLLRPFDDGRMLSPVGALVLGDAFKQRDQREQASEVWRRALPQAPAASWIETALQVRLGQTPYGER